MKKIKFLVIIFALIAAVSGLCLCACNSDCGSKAAYEISVNAEKSTVIEVGAEIDYTQYFTVKDNNGNQIVVTESMLDLKNADTAVPGSFTVTITVGGTSGKVTFTVIPKDSGSTDDPSDPSNPSNPSNPTDLNTVFAKYADSSKWNFAVNYTGSDGNESFEEYYEYRGDDILNKYTGTDGSEYTDYLSYDSSAGKYYYYMDNGDGTYTKYDENTDEFTEAYSYLSIIYLSELKNYSFTGTNGAYTADKPSDAGNAIIGEYTGYTWTKLTVYVANGNVTKVVGVQNDGYTMTFALTKQGLINFTLPNASSGGSTTPTEPTGTMEKQTYDAATFDKENLQDKMKATEGAIGLPSTGNISALVIPVQFKGDTITQNQLTRLNTAFNGTSEETGWESVKTYYQKASYGKLNLSFDIQSVYQANNTSSYYESYKQSYTQDGETYTRTGEEVILTEALAYYESRLDLTKYDTNGDGTIDAVYLIYSASVDYTNADFYWAYVTWYYGETKYDGLDAFYYLFAGFDFMEDNESEPFPAGSGMKVNAATYIHETGHLLGLDDYYDYDTSKGSNEGLGGADMMDNTVGDHNVYSKTMLGWLNPTIVTSTTTLNIESSQASASAILIPLNFNNSYFCEYLLIDLYSAQGLNKMHASISDSILYDGAAYGVRIYHVSSSINDPFNNDFGSFTDNNNSMSDIALIKLVEADGGKKLSGDNYATENDLWQAGDSLSGVFPNYMRNDGKKVNFDITINSVSATSASITITFDS